MYSRRRKETRMQYYLKTTEAVMKELDSRQNGLDSREAESRLEKHGRNKLAEAKKDSLFKRFIMQLADPMILVLIVAAAISGVTSYCDYHGSCYHQCPSGYVSGEQSRKGNRSIAGNGSGYKQSSQKWKN